MTTVCAVCGATIHLIPVGVAGNHKWVTNPNRVETWHCGNDPDFPVRTHVPLPV